jgi:hypothetical protein
MAKKKVDPDKGIHSCAKCRDFDRHVRRLHDVRLANQVRTNGGSAPFNKQLEAFEQEMSNIDRRIKQDRASGLMRF